MTRFTTIALAVALASAVPVFAQEPQTQPAPSQNLSLTTVHGVFAPTVSATGRVHALTTARLGPRVSGRLAEFGTLNRQALDVGMSVKKGQKLFSLDLTTFQNNVTLASAQLDSAKASLTNLIAPTRDERLEQLKQEVVQLDARATDKARERDRYKRLVEQEKTLPPRRLEEVEVDLTSLIAQKKSAESRLLESQRGPTPSEVAVAAARVKEGEATMRIAETDLRDAVVSAPFDAVITQRYKSTGDYLVNMPPTEVMELISIDLLEAEIAIPESYLPHLKADSTQLVIKSPLLKQPLSLPITRIVEQIDPTKGTFVVRVRIPADQRDRLVAGAFITAELTLPENAGGVIAPVRAVVREADKTFVYIARDGKMLKQAVQLGDKLSEGVIISGVKEGDALVLGPAAELADGKELPPYLKP